MNVATRLLSLSHGVRRQTRRLP